MRIIGTLLAVVGVGAGVALARRVASGTDHDTTSRWLAVTVNTEVTVEGLPEPLRRLGDQVRVRVRPAPGDRGTEILARPTRPVPAGGRLRESDPRPAVRRALREAKSLLETGEVLRPSRPGSNRPTLPGRLLDVVIGRAQGEGRL
jgi:hypothetical protein